MESVAAKKEIIQKLQSEILAMQGFRQPLDKRFAVGLGVIEAAFPNHTFPTGVIHEFLSNASEEAAATLGFMSGLLAALLQQPGPCVWISCRRTLFPPALKLFGIDAGRIIFIDLAKPKDLLWTMEEALKCDGLSAVVGEVSGITFTESRRLQLAAEHSRVTGLMHCYQADKMGNSTSVARWRVTPWASSLHYGMPGVGYPSWNVELLKVRNGRPGAWQMQWNAGVLRQVQAAAVTNELLLNQTG